MGKTREVKATEATERMAKRLTRTDRDQLALIKKRRGKSLKETARLTADVLMGEDEAKRTLGEKPTLPISKTRYKKGAKNAKS